MKSLILPPPAGFFSIFNHVVGALLHIEYPTEGYREFYQADPFVTLYDTFYSTDDRNLWDLFFEPIGSKEDNLYLFNRVLIRELMLEGMKECLFDTDGELKLFKTDHSCPVGLGFSSNNVEEQVARCQGVVRKHIRVLPFILRKVEREVEFFKGKVVGIHYRGTDKPRELLPYLKATGRREKIFSIEEYIEEAHKLSPDRIFLATDSEEALDRALKIDSTILYSGCKRSWSEESLHEGNGNELRAEESLIDTLVLSRCCHIIHSLSNIPQAAFFMNPKLTGTFLI